MKTIKLGLQLLTALTVGIVLTACEKTEPITTAADPTGVYTLTSVDAKPVPATISHEGTPLKVVSGTFNIAANGTCISKMVFVPPSGAEATREVKATYTKDGAKLTMKWEGAGTTTGAVEGNTFMMNNEGMTLVYKK